MQVDIAILTALAQEKAAVIDAFQLDNIKSFTFYGDMGREYEIRERSVPGSDPPTIVRIAICPITGAGPIRAAVHTSQMIIDLAPTLTILVGIAGCMEDPDNKKIELGDVAICTNFHDILLEKRVDGRVKREVKGASVEPSLLTDIMEWVQPQTWSKTLTLAPPEPRGDQKAVFGAFVSGNYVLADQTIKEELLQTIPDRRLLAIEMEASGVHAVLAESHGSNSFLVIKALSDWASGDKGDNNPKKDLWHSYACKIAAEFTRELIMSRLYKKIRKYRSVPSPATLFRQRTSIACRSMIKSQDRTAPFVPKLSEAIMEDYLNEIESLMGQSETIQPVHRNSTPFYSANIDQGHQFLTRARALFGPATRVLAFSLDSVSTFWRSETFSWQVREYIDNQAGGGTQNENVIRNFVFSTPEEAHRYSRILDYHHEQYKNTYVLSREHYEQILHDHLASDATSAITWAKRDFALLEYEQDMQIVKFLAYMEDSNLKVIPVLRDIVDGLNTRNLTQFFIQIQEGEPGAGRLLRVSGVPIVRWDSQFWRKHSEWSEALSAIFSTTTAFAYHLVGFTSGKGGGENSVREVIAQMKMDITTGEYRRTSWATKHKIKSARIGRRIKYEDDARPREIFTNGRLKYEDKGVPETMIVMRFEDRQSLHSYLTDKEHSLLRFGLFLKLAEDNHKLKVILEKYNLREFKDLTNLDVSLQKNIYERLEAEAGIWRVDLLDDEVLDVIVKTEPPKF